ncbi:hypothetical protein BD779DRAFT_334018 [Infundibulicybe gibba]|nr:hypothetical protein BD779DRAFT_334018 [Infundibulicybe gibba]
MSTRLKEWLPNPESSAQPVFNCLEDDRESFLHVMNWVALRYMHHDRSAESLTDLLVEAFEKVHYSHGVYYNFRFRDRMDLLTGWAGVRVDFQNEAMRALLVRLATDMAIRYDPKQVFCHDEHQHLARAMEEANKLMQAHVVTRGWLTGVLAEALASESGWAPFEGRVEHRLVPHHTAPRGTKRKKGSTGYQEDFASLDLTDGPNPNKWRRVILLD